MMINYTQEQLMVAFKVETPLTDKAHEARYEQEFLPADFEEIRGKCSFAAHLMNDAATLGEQEWYNGMRLISKCERGNELAHEMSEGYPDYNVAKTEEKLEHCSQYGPPMCESIREELGWSGCESCLHKDLIKSPIQLGSQGVAIGPLLTAAEAPAILDAKMKLLGESNFEAFFEDDTFEAIAALKDSKRDAFMANLRSLLNQNRSLGPSVSLRDVHRRIKLALASRKKRARAEKSEHKGGKPKIIINRGQLSDRGLQVIDALLLENEEDMTLFRRNMRMVKAIIDKDGMAMLIDVDEKLMLKILADCMSFYIEDEDELRDADPDYKTINYVLAAAKDDGIEQIDGLTTAPVPRPDGTFVAQAGYDYDTKLFFHGDVNIDLNIPACPTEEEVQSAVGAILYPFNEFPWNDESWKPNLLAMLLTMLCRPVIDGNVPIFGVLANLQGSGKTLLIELAFIIIYGDKSFTSYTAVSTEDEWRKRLATILKAGYPCCCIDNVNGFLNSDALASIATSSTYSDRLLGGNELIIAKNNTIFIVNGNNLRVGADLQRRFVLLELRSEEERPDQKGGYAIPNVREWVKEHRCPLLVSLMVLVRAWHARGCPPNPSSRAFGNFEAWSHMIGGILSVARVPGLRDNEERLNEISDSESNTWGLFLRAIFLKQWDAPFLIMELSESICGSVDDGMKETLPEYMSSYINDYNSGKLSSKLGNAFRQLIHKPCSGFVLTKGDKDKAANVRTYQVECKKVHKLPAYHRSCYSIFSSLRMAGAWGDSGPLAGRNCQTDFKELAMWSQGAQEQGADFEPVLVQGQLTESDTEDVTKSLQHYCAMALSIQDESIIVRLLQLLQQKPGLGKLP